MTREERQTAPLAAPAAAPSTLDAVIAAALVALDPTPEQLAIRALAASVTPVKSWRAAAAVLGLSEDALQRHRKAHGDRTVRPWWRSPGAVVACYEALIAPPPAPPPARRRPETVGAIDPRAVARNSPADADEDGAPHSHHTPCGESR
jgi:hypothetical protein